MADIVDDHNSILNTITRGALAVDLLSVKFDPQNTTLMGKISQFVSALVNDYHYIVLDLPNEMDDVVMKTLTQSDIIHLVAIDNEKDLDTTRHVIDSLSEQLKERFHAESVQVIISGVNTGTIFLPWKSKKYLTMMFFWFYLICNPRSLFIKKLFPVLLLWK